MSTELSEIVLRAKQVLEETRRSRAERDRSASATPNVEKMSVREYTDYHHNLPPGTRVPKTGPNKAWVGVIRAYYSWRLKEALEVLRMGDDEIEKLVGNEKSASDAVRTIGRHLSEILGNLKKWT